MGLLIRDGHLVVKDGSLVVGNDLACCCGACCCLGTLTCCDAVAQFMPGMDCGGAAHQIQVRWQWQQNGETCRFVWEIADLNILGYNGANGFADYPAAECTDPAGAWTCDPAREGEHGFFNGNTDQNIFSRCDWSGATVTISKVGDGYQFDVTGVEAVPGWGCDCPAMDAAYLVQC